MLFGKITETAIQFNLGDVGMTTTASRSFDQFQHQRFTVPTSSIDTCLKPREVDICAKFIKENEIDSIRFNQLYNIAKKVRFGQFVVDFTELGASIDDSNTINQLYRSGLNFYQLGIYLKAKSNGVSNDAR